MEASKGLKIKRTTLRSRSKPRSGVGLLRKFGISEVTVEKNVTKQVVQMSLEALNHQGSTKEQTIELASKILPVVGDKIFSPLWIAVHDRMSSLSHHMDFAEIKNRLNATAMENYTKDAVDSPALHRLWQTHLPSLEYAVLTLVQVLSSQTLIPSVVVKAVNDSGLADVSSRDPLIFRTVCSMLEALLCQTDYSPQVLEILTTFCSLTSKSARVPYLDLMRVHPSPSSCFYQLETVFRMCPSSMPSPVLGDFIHQLYEMWTKLEGSHSAKVLESVPSPSSFHRVSQAGHCVHTGGEISKYFEAFWILTLYHRDWVCAALKYILDCEDKYIEASLWLVAAHNRIILPSMKDLRRELMTFTHLLRDLLHTPTLTAGDLLSIKTALATVTESIAVTEPEMKGTCTGTLPSPHRLITRHLLMAFLLQSTSGFSCGKEILALVSETSDAWNLLLTLTYHLQILAVEPDLWHKCKKDALEELLKALNKDIHMEKLTVDRQRDVDICMAVFQDVCAITES